LLPASLGAITPSRLYPVSPTRKARICFTWPWRRDDVFFYRFSCGHGFEAQYSQCEKDNYLGKFTQPNKTVEKPVSDRLMENVHPAATAGRNPEE
jgi:hypothetical protein